jgi:diacylglycerol kinase (ATP)
MRITLVHNPKAGSGSPSKKDRIAAIRSAGHDVVYLSEAGLGALVAAARRSDLIAVAGGDGTVAKVAKQMAGRDVPLTVLPLGTANNIAASLGVARGGDLASQAAGWSKGARRPFDLGRASSAGRKRVFFLESVGGGLFANVIADAEAEKVRGREPEFGTPHDAIARALARLREVLGRAEAQDWRVELDGADHSGRYLLVEAMNVRYIGPNLKLAPDADFGDGLLDVVLLDESRRARFDDYLRRRLAGAEVLPNLPVLRARRVTVAPRDKQALHVDDRLWSKARGKRGAASVQLQLERHALTFLVPTRSG